MYSVSIEISLTVNNDIEWSLWIFSFEWPTFIQNFTLAVWSAKCFKDKRYKSPQQLTPLNNSYLPSITGLLVRLSLHVIVNLHLVVIFGDIADPLFGRVWVLHADGADLSLGNRGCWHGEGTVRPLLQLVRDLIVGTQWKVQDKQVVFVSSWKRRVTVCVRTNVMLLKPVTYVC